MEYQLLKFILKTIIGMQKRVINKWRAELWDIVIESVMQLHEPTFNFWYLRTLDQLIEEKIDWILITHQHLPNFLKLLEIMKQS